MSGDPSDLAVLVHEIRSPVAALVAIADAYPGADERAPGAAARARRGALVEHRAPPRRGPTVSLRSERIDVGRLTRDAAETAALTSGQQRRLPDGGRALGRWATRSGCDRRSTT